MDLNKKLEQFKDKVLVLNEPELTKLSTGIINMLITSIDLINEKDTKVEDLEKELEEVKIKNIQLHSRIKVLQIELAHKNAADSKINFKGDIDGNDINTEIEIIDEYMKNVRPYYESKKAKPDCTGCVRANGAGPADVYHGTCFYCCRPDWSNTDHYEAKGE